MIQESKTAIFTDRSIAFHLCDVALDVNKVTCQWKFSSCISTTQDIL